MREDTGNSVASYLTICVCTCSRIEIGELKPSFSRSVALYHCRRRFVRGGMSNTALEAYMVPSKGFSGDSSDPSDETPVGVCRDDTSRNADSIRLIVGGTDEYRYVITGNSAWETREVDNRCVNRRSVQYYGL